MGGTGKHFPGYTFCGLDPHGDLPLVDRRREQIEAEELAVFREVGKECEAIMVGHAQFPAWGKDSGPASLNRDIVTGLLNGAMGYQGLVMTGQEVRCQDIKLAQDLNLEGGGKLADFRRAGWGENNLKGRHGGKFKFKFKFK